MLLIAILQITLTTLKFWLDNISHFAVQNMEYMVFAHNWFVSYLMIRQQFTCLNSVYRPFLIISIQL